jgi:AbrB family looped-hinge helix DNA binding protein
MIKRKRAASRPIKESHMELVKVKRNYQITIPQNLRRLIRLAVGDYVEVDIQDDTLVIRPVKVIHPDQEYFFTKEWQEKEAEAEKDIAEGKVIGPFEDAQDALKALKNQPL